MASTWMRCIYTQCVTVIVATMEKYKNYMKEWCGTPLPTELQQRKKREHQSRQFLQSQATAQQHEIQPFDIVSIV